MSCPPHCDSPSRPHRLRIGFLPFHVDYYNAVAADLAPRKHALIRECRATLEVYGEVVGPDAPLTTRDAAVKAGEELHQSGVDCVIVLPVIAVFSGLSEAAVDKVDTPLMLWHCQEIATVDEHYSMVEIVRNTGQIGVQALANVLARRGRTFQVLCASRHSPETTRGLEEFFKVVQARKALENASVLQIGSAFPEMTDVFLSEPHRRSLGLGVSTHSVNEFTETYLGISAQDSAEEVERMKKQWTVEHISEDELLRSAKIWLAVKQLLGNKSYSCATINSHGENCLRNPEIGVTATYAISRLAESGIPCSEVGDIPTALALLLMRTLAGDALYTEVQVLDEARQAIVLANSGEAADGVRADGVPVRLLGNTNFRGVHGRGASFAYPIDPGAATVVSLSPIGETSFRLIAMEGSILKEPLPDTGAITGFFEFSHTKLHDGYRRWIEAGPVHHAATARGHHAKALRKLAVLMDWEIITI